MEADWTRVRELFDRTVHLDVDARVHVLEQECAGEPDLRRRVEQLLIAHDAASGFLSAPTEPRPDSLAATLEAIDLAPGTMIGPYKLLQQIGEGGFGVVYMAEQQEPIVRKVALKVIKLGMDTKQVIARFEGERQALALMDHPNIARIFDAGATETGRLYFVMELVRGIPITEYCDRERLTPRQRLELFIPVCHAVAHAHQKGVIHRDLKPSNVLVTLHDGKPVPEVIDFGIARALHQRLTERTLFTEYGQLIGTPEYMSPEQGEMSGLDIDTRTDIYSLGALLYELLSGEKLFEPRRLRSLALQEIQRVLREEEPPRPSARVSSLGASAMEIAERRGVQAPQLIRMLRGDPDWIVVKAIAKDRTRRYDSAGALAADIERSLRSEPVSAGPPSIRYRVSRFVRRHRVAVGVALVLMASLLLGTMVATLGLVRARRAEAIARREARQNALDAEAMRALLLEDQRAYVDRMEEAIALRHAMVPADTLALVNQLINAYGLLGGLRFLGYTLPPRVDSLRTRLGANVIDIALSLESASPPMIKALGIIKEDVAREYPERFPDYLRSLLILRQRAGDPDSVLVADRTKLSSLLREKGNRALRAGRAEAARPLMTEALEQALATVGHPGGRWALAAARGDLGACLTDLGEYAAAESLLLDSYRTSGAREQLMRLIRLYEKSGRLQTARSFATRTQVASVRDLGALPGAPSTAGRGHGFSAQLGDRLVWVFGVALVRNPSLPPRRNIRWNSGSWTTDRDARDGVDLRHPLDSLGLPLELLSLTQAERARHETADFTPSLQPLGLVGDPARNRVLVQYAKLVSPWKWAGTSFAIWRAGERKPRRLVLRPGSLEPTLLFQEGEPGFGVGTVVARDTLYLYGVRAWANLRPETVIGRVPLARALDRHAWRYYAGQGRWSPEVRDAVVVVNGAGCVHWNEYLQKFVLIDVVPLTEFIEMRTSDRPEGPWSAAEVIYTMPAPGGVAVHTGLAREGGRVQYLTHSRDLGFFDSEGRLIEVAFK